MHSNHCLIFSKPKEIITAKRREKAKKIYDRLNNIDILFYLHYACNVLKVYYLLSKHFQKQNDLFVGNINTEAQCARETISALSK